MVRRFLLLARNHATHFPHLIQLLLVSTLTYSCEVIVHDDASHREAIIYYSNETVPEALSSKNYQTFLHLLDRSGSRSALEIRDALLQDVSDAAPNSSRDVEALRTAARQAKVALIVFSNTLALRNQYHFYDPASDRPIVVTLPRISGDDDSLLALSPLSRPGQIKVALDAALAQLGGNSAAIALIVRSHGSAGMSLMPRVNLDFTQIGEDDILRALDDVSHDDLQLPDLNLQGTSQIEFWRILEDVGKEHRTNFPIVFLSSCESGAQTVSEVSSIPGSVKLIVHSGNSGMSSAAISYDTVFSTMSRYGVGINAVSSAMVSGLMNAGQGLRSDTPLTAWRWPFISHFSRVPWWVFLIPLITWTLWAALTFAVRKRGAASVLFERDC